MIDQLMQALARFRNEANDVATFNKIFGKPAGATLRGHFLKICERDVISFYSRVLDADQRLLFEAHLSAQLPPTCHDSPRCVECGSELTESDIEAGEDVCIDCAVEIALAERGGLTSDIDHEPGSLLATVRVRLEEMGLEDPLHAAPDE